MTVNTDHRQAPQGSVYVKKATEKSVLSSFKEETNINENMDPTLLSMLLK